MKERLHFYRFSDQKNRQLIEERGISFEEIIAAIDSGLLLDVLEHPNKKQYPNQEIYVVFVNDYVYLVLFVREDNGDIFLKTIIPSRKAKKQYIIGEPNDE